MRVESVALLVVGEIIIKGYDHYTADKPTGSKSAVLELAAAATAAVISARPGVPVIRRAVALPLCVGKEFVSSEAIPEPRPVVVFWGQGPIQCEITCAPKRTSEGRRRRQRPPLTSSSSSSPARRTAAASLGGSSSAREEKSCRAGAATARKAKFDIAEEERDFSAINNKACPPFPCRDPRISAI